MTSSLVGSEMCIRDSVGNDVRTCLGMSSQTFGDLGGEGGGGQIPKRIWSCLLYTSDAADDM
eukprot:1391994-Prorocentrum_lima.AAC.1